MEVFENTIRTAILYFLVAVGSGIAATFALVRKELTETLPGIAVAVALIPPLAIIGIWVGAFDLVISKYYLLVFLFNLVGVVVGSLITFSILKFYKTEKEVKVKTEEISEQEEKEAEKK